MDEDYPEVGGYHLLVQDRRHSSEVNPQTLATTREHIEMVVAACMDAEFEAYKTLPLIDEKKLLPWYASNGTAYKDLIHTLQKVTQRSWTLTNFHNPSTKRLISMTVKEIREGTTVVRTTEYWYLRWWSTVEGKYRNPYYRETSHHTYVLKQHGDDWLIEENIQPPSLSNRQ
ncbi:hypothetical protein [Polaromonas eurypsychrophila]|uniref:Uncharacterized protein n=1 Tax=Polaromonas eurypsychrophila TaxID=1614635 RepID=A0A916WM65_9BURK|nr:hypothetical protein [Polaromonas eurypsychrophila]GGB11388.1 hypothetical protein GCM10011496_35380 [Polaromonas eurypsychrophila]